MNDPRDQAARAAVEARDLTKRFGTFTAVDAVTFEVQRGEVFGFLGPNGAGKTTTIKMLTGLLRPTSGACRVGGYDLLADGEAVKRTIGYMSQLFSLYADLSVEENIEFFAGLYGVTGARRAERKAWVVDMAGLADHRKTLTRDLPLGWKQRLALGCAVLHEPPILFLDEPTSGVDPMARRRFWDLIYAMTETGTTVFVSTHYMEEAEYCHRLALMNRGRVIALDTPAGLRAGMKEPLLEVRVVNSAAAAHALRGADEILEAGLFGRDVHVAVRDAASGRAAIERRLRAQGIEILGIESIEPSLEDVFIAKVRDAGGVASA